MPVPGKRLVDATLGGGGHAEALLAAGAEVIGVDRDPAAIAAAQARLAGSERFSALEGRAGELEALLGPLGLLPVDGVLMDLGVSSPQLDTPERGFSFQTDGPLDMRMGSSGETAAELIARLSEAELAARAARARRGALRPPHRPGAEAGPARHDARARSRR